MRICIRRFSSVDLRYARLYQSMLEKWLKPTLSFLRVRTCVKQFYGDNESNWYSTTAFTRALSPTSRCFYVFYGVVYVIPRDFLTIWLNSLLSDWPLHPALFKDPTTVNDSSLLKTSNHKWKPTQFWRLIDTSGTEIWSVFTQLNVQITCLTPVIVQIHSQINSTIYFL